MELKHLFTGDDTERAVSPVIGVILMVAITVILAAVIGTFVLGLGDQVQQTSPNAQWNWDQGTAGDSSPDLTLTHEGGDSVESARTEVTNSGAGTVDNDCGQGDWSSTTITAGTSCDIVNDGNTVDGTYRLIWTAEGGGTSSTLSTYEAN
ncbi:type IV pilin [Natronomonas sp. CBA1123]|uniref:type IV pilin n=1 Tax=Natronomonas sp. CBA1123 TaxID=2668070 RepID=UPI0012E9DAA5|nr:type IV pilin N-terminal domain-containing protein [Natronomonas sp. CBA1123]MUV85086.1 type IV pilin [Natronomonas sp. CBA1123]